jgi:cysteine desulfurase/selenocysteine lyase
VAAPPIDLSSLNLVGEHQHGREGGIGARSGCFCAQPYVAGLLRDAEAEAALLGRGILAGDKSGKPGMVRVSFGAYNSFDDVDALVEMLRRITRNEYQGHYYLDPESGAYAPAGYRDSIAEHFSLSGAAFQNRAFTIPAGR